MHAKPRRSRARPGPEAQEHGASAGGGDGAAARAEEKPAGMAEDGIVIRIRLKRPLDPWKVNESLIHLMQEEDERDKACEATQASRAHMTRQRIHHLHTKQKIMTVPALVQWANGRHLNPLYVQAVAIARVLCHKT